jgi:hypothetical protein
MHDGDCKVTVANTRVRFDAAALRPAKALCTTPPSWLSCVGITPFRQGRANGGRTASGRGPTGRPSPTLGATITPGLAAPHLEVPFRLADQRKPRQAAGPSAALARQLEQAL